MTLRRLKHFLGLQAARHGSERLFARIGDGLVEIPFEANVISFPTLGILYAGIGQPQSLLCRLRNGRLEPVGEEEAEGLRSQIDVILAHHAETRNAEALAKVNAAVAEASKDLPAGWRLTIGPDGMAKAVRNHGKTDPSAESQGRQILSPEEDFIDPSEHCD